MASTYRTHYGPWAWWLVLAAGLLSGCAETPRKFEPVAPIPAGQGVVYLYRPAEPGADGIVGTVTANGVPLVQMKNGGYFPYVANAGPAYFQAITTDPRRTLVSKAVIRVDAGTEKFMKVSLVRDRLRFSPVFPEVGRSEIAACALQEPAAVHLAAGSPRPAVAAPGYYRRRAGAAGVPIPAESPRRQGLYSFEAEKLAIDNGCSTPDGVRPTAYLVQHDENVDVYDVVCGSVHMSVGCLFQYCELLD